MSKNKAAIVAVLGASGSGKSTFVKQTLARLKPKRRLVWDPMREYQGNTTGSLGELLNWIERDAGGVSSAVFRPASSESVRAHQFDVFCAAALAAGNLTLVVEELRFVTTPSRAPLRWAEATMTGRHRGLKVIGTSQRPASIDKDFLGNATLIHTGRLVYPEDIRAVAKAMQIEEGAIAALAPLDWIEKDTQTGKRRSGRVVF